MDDKEMKNETIEEKLANVEPENIVLAVQRVVYKREIEQVRRLGEMIGYGNMMSIASVLWAMMLEEKHGITSGAFVATIQAFMKKREAEKVVKEREARKEFFKKLGI